MAARSRIATVIAAFLFVTTLSPPGAASAAEELPVISPQPASMRRLGPDLALSSTAIEVGTPSARSRQILESWNLPLPSTLAAGGYVLGVGSYGRENLAVAVGKDEAGAFYARQTLAQLTKRRAVASVAIVDEPAFALRGGMESFYGTPWRQADLLRHLDFLGAHRMNAFQYTVSGDPHTAGSQWRTPYSGADAARIQEAITRAKANFVEFIYRINPEANVDPGAGICHALQADKDALIARYQQLWDFGERTFSIGWDDVGGNFACTLDQQRFGGDASPLAAAQAHVVNDVYARFIQTHPGARLVTVPTEYWGTGTSAYRSRYAQLIPAAVDIFWTGREVVSKTISKEDAAAASAAFGGRKLLIFDNYPVNDYSPMSQHLGALTGRDAALPEHATGFLANEMQEAEASLLSLFTVGEYAWNPAAYNAAESWQRSLAEFGGSVAGELRRYAEVNSGSPLYDDASAPLSAVVRPFIAAYRSGSDLTPTAGALIAYLDQLAQAPTALRSGLGNQSFLTDSEPWLAKTEGRARAGLAAVRALQAKAAGDLAGYRAQRELMVEGSSSKLSASGALDDLLDLAGVARGAGTIRGDSGAMSVFRLGRNGRVQSSYQTAAGSSWSPLIDLPQVSAAGVPSVVSRRDGALTAFVRGTDDRVWTSSRSAAGGVWSAWSAVSDGRVGGDPAVVEGDDGKLSVFVRGADGLPATIWQTAAGWSPLTSLPGITMLGTPAVDVTLDGLLTAVVRGSDNQLWTNWQTAVGGSWNGWVRLGGSIASNPDLVRSANGAYSAI